MRPVVLALLAPLAGCAVDGIDGNWLLYFDDFTVMSEEYVGEFNYVGAQIVPNNPPSDDGWAEDETEDDSEQVVFAQVIDVAGEDEKLLVMGNVVLRGNREGFNDPWVFTGGGQSAWREAESHTSGYEFDVHGDYQQAWSLEVDLDRASLAMGVLRVNLDYLDGYVESDTWDPLETGFDEAQSHPEWYLADADGNPITNDVDTADCTSSPCFVDYELLLSREAPVTARRSYLTTEELESVYGAGQPAGLPGDIPIGGGR